MIEAVQCLHCDRLTLLRTAKACACDKQQKLHIVCDECAKNIPEDKLGELI